MSTERMDFRFDDGGRSITRRGYAGDCVARAIAIVSGFPYEEIYEVLAEGDASDQVKIAPDARIKTADYGISVNREWFKKQMQTWGFTWVSCTDAETGHKTHLVNGDLPMGRLVVELSGHYMSVIDGVIHDTGNPQIVYKDDGTEHFERHCIYGYWVYNQSADSDDFAGGTGYRPKKHIEHLFQKDRYNLKRCLRKPAGWFSDEVKNLAKVYGAEIANPSSIMEACQGSGDRGLTSKIVPGNLYMCRYSPPAEHSLPYYDRFPLIMPYKTESRMFRAWNFHYLPHQARILLLAHLMKYADTKSFWTRKPVLNNKTSMQFDGRALKDLAAHPVARPTSHEYQLAHVKTQFKFIEPKHWALMMLLPTESFVMSKKSQVWADVVVSAADMFSKMRKKLHAERSTRILSGMLAE